MTKAVLGLSGWVLALACAGSAAWAADLAATTVPPREKGPFPVLSLPEKAYSGQRAIDALGERLADVAAWYGLSPADFKARLLQDRTLHVDQQGRLFYVEMPPRTPVPSLDAGSSTPR